MVDITRDPRWGRCAEGAGEDPYLGSVVAAASVRGYQGTPEELYNGNEKMLACVKHFALYGGPDAGLDYTEVDMSPARMYNEYLPPYKAAIDAGVGSLMTSFNDINGMPATANKWLFTEVLRNQWGFEGFVVSDYNAVGELIKHRVGANRLEAGVAAINAGLDMDMVNKRSQVSSWLEGGGQGVTEKDQHPLSLAGPKNKQKKREKLPLASNKDF
jgi:beta-glucosidase